MGNRYFEWLSEIPFSSVDFRVNGGQWDSQASGVGGDDPVVKVPGCR
jgi:hypothetical protein